MSALAIKGGRPVRDTMLPYARHSIDEQDIQAVDEQSVQNGLRLGQKFSSLKRRWKVVAASPAVTVSSGCAALYADEDRSLGFAKR